MCLSCHWAAWPGNKRANNRHSSLWAGRSRTVSGSRVSLTVGEAPRGVSRPQRPRLAQDVSGGTRRHQQAAGISIGPRRLSQRPQDSPGGSTGPQRSQKAPGGSRRPQQAPGSGPAQPARLSAACTTTVNTRSTHSQHHGQHAVNATVNIP